MSGRYREVAPATDILAKPPSFFESAHDPGAVIVTADGGWAWLVVMVSGKSLGVAMSRDEVTRLYDLLGEAERHLWMREREADDD